MFFYGAKVGIFFAFCLIAAWAFCCAMLFAQSPQGLERFALAQAARALHFFARTKKRSKEIRRLHFFAYSGTFLR